jgi:hypothetical protein
LKLHAGAPSYRINRTLYLLHDTISASSKALPLLCLGPSRCQQSWENIDAWPEFIGEVIDVQDGRIFVLHQALARDISNIRLFRRDSFAVLALRMVASPIGCIMVDAARSPVQHRRELLG